ncbi:trichohyalin isoform X2 [Synchiropus splendidus]|uniref:trichohyalin isoform X2 n=1 Tax=Synchiropus splendidus TaxID=270530 RepID=UPI00237EBC72|nr:trichohyalin isoform X2 [Synchiropus splendidus]
MEEEVRTMTWEKDRVELVWRERLLRCQRQLKAKEEEMSRQSQYFEGFKSQLQHKLTVSRDREENLQNRIYTLEKQLLELTVSAATGVAAISQVRIASETPVQVDELLFLRGEGEGEEENREERRKIVHHQGTEQKEEPAADGYAKESQLRKCLLNLKADLNVLLEREESGMMMRRKMVEELQEAQENSHFLSCKVEEMEAEILQLKLAERSLLQEVDELREENYRLKEKQSGVTNQTSDQSAAIPESTGPYPSSLSGSTAVCSVPSTTNRPHPSAGSDGEFVLDIKDVKSSAVSHFGHQGAVMSTFSLAVETVDDLKFGSWCSSGALNLEEAPSEESDALREAYRSLGFGEDLQALQEQCDCLEAALQQAQVQLQVLSQENTQLKEQLGKQTDGEPAIAEEGEEPSSLVKALNEENRALAARIQELVAHSELDDEVRRRDESQMKERVSTLEEERVRLELEVQEQACLITELTKKTEDDLNSIMELQQKLHQCEKRVQETAGIRELCRSPCPSALPPTNIDDVIDILVESVINLDEEPQESSPKSSPHSNVQALSEGADQLTKSIQHLREEEQELLSNIRSLREQQREVTLSVQALAEEKRQLTRQVWGLKEEKDDVSKALSGLQQEKEHLKRAVCGLKEQLRRCTSELEMEREKVLSSKSDEIDFIQTLQAEKEQLSQTVLSLKQEKDELMAAIQGLKEERQQFIVGAEGHDSLLKSLSSLKDERKELEDSISCLREEERRVKDAVEDLKEQRRKQNVKQKKSPLLTADCQRAELLRELEDATLRGLCKEEARSSSAGEREALSAELKKSQKELDTKHQEVKELRLKVSKLQGEKADVLTLQAQVEEKYNITAAQLKAKSGALDQLNSEYMALKSRGNQDDVTVELVSLRSQHDSIRAKYDSLLRSKSPSDLDLVPLKAKLSCLVSKCQERNSVLVQLVKAMRKHGCLEASLSKQVDRLLSDAVLDDYSKTLIPGGHQKTQSPCGRATPGPTSVNRCQEYTGEVTTDHLTPVLQHGATDMPSTPGAAAQANNSDVKSVLTTTRKDKANHPVPCLYSNTSNKVQPSPDQTAEQGSSAKKVPSSPNKPDKYRLVQKAESTPDLSRLTSASSSPLAEQCHDSSSRRRLSSPEKIINLHQQLQQTLLSSFQAPRGFGWEEQWDKSQSCVSNRDSKSLPPSLRGSSVTMATEEPPSAKSPSLFKAVTSRSANLPFGPNMLTNQSLRAVKSSCIFGSATSVNANSTSRNSTKITSVKPKVTTLRIPDKNDSRLTEPSSSDPKTRPQNSPSLDFPPKTPASGTAATSLPLASDGAFKSTTSLLDDAASSSLSRPTSCTRSEHSSPERTYSRGSPVPPPEKMKQPRPNPEAPSEVCSVKVIRRVGQCSLMIGWERPPLDELGCSNGTFVYGYRVFVDGSFHKSVLSSACTKCVLENVDASVPVNISVQTLGANGLCSNRVQVAFESAGSAEH